MNLFFVRTKHSFFIREQVSFFFFENIEFTFDYYIELLVLFYFFSKYREIISLYSIKLLCRSGFYKNGYFEFLFNL